jgi:hypothetical protein
MLLMLPMHRHDFLTLCAAIKVQHRLLLPMQLLQQPPEPCTPACSAASGS